MIKHAGAWALGWMVLAVLGAGCRPGSTSPASPPALRDDVLVAVDTSELTRADLESELVRRSARTPVTNLVPVLEELADRQRMVAEARRLGLDQDPAVRRALDAVLIARLKEVELEARLARPTAGPDRAQNPPATTAAATSGPLQSQFAWLRLEAGRSASPQRRAELRRRLEEARVRALDLGPESPGFGPLAVQYSDDDDTRALGGDLGWFPASAEGFPGGEPVRRAAAALVTPGSISPVIETPTGFHVVRLLGRRNAPDGPRAAAQAAAREALDRRRSIEQDYLAELRSRFPARYNTNAIEAASSAWLRRSAEPGPAAPRIGGAQ